MAVEFLERWNCSGSAMMTVTNSIKEVSLEDLPTYDATQLTKGGDLARIKLGDQLYTLRITRSGKLILTKWVQIL